MNSDGFAIGIGHQAPAALDASACPSGRLISVAEEALLFRRMRRRVLANLVTGSLEQSRLRIGLVVMLTSLLWAVLFLVFSDAFRFIAVSLEDSVMRDETIRALMSLFFASLAVMLTISTGILLYGNLYRSDEVRFLLTSPVRDERIFLHKFEEAIFFSTWAFLLMGSPMLVAYGVAEGAGWWYFAALIPYTACFAYIPGCVGAIACLLIVRFMPARKIKLFAAIAMIVGAIAFAALWATASQLEPRWLTPRWFEEMLTRMRMAEYRLLPNWWLSSGLLEAADGTLVSPLGQRALRECLLFLALLTSNALIFHLLAVACAGLVFRTGYSALHGDRQSEKRVSAQSAARWGSSGSKLIPESLTLLVLKDVKLFRRDSVQWSQFIIFLSLLSLYFFNTRKLGFNVDYSAWINMVSFLNLAIIGLILSTFTTRFIFPLISLEGRRFWILGLLPVRRDIILWGKFLFATVGSLLPCTLLALLSDFMLGVSSDLLLVHLYICILLSMGLSGIAVGLGARFPNFKHDSPARIAAGFGGTLTLILSTSYIMAVVLLAAVPCHFYSALAGAGEPELFGFTSLTFWWVVCLGSSLLLGMIVTAVPMWIGLRWFRRIEI